MNTSERPVQGAVRYITGPTPPPTAPTEGLYPLENGDVGGPMRLGETAETQLLYPRMAVEMAGLIRAEMADYDLLHRRIADLFGPSRDYDLGVSSFAISSQHRINLSTAAARRILPVGRSFPWPMVKMCPKLELQAAEYRKRLAGLEPRLPNLQAAALAPDADGSAVEAHPIAQSHIPQMNEKADRLKMRRPISTRKVYP